MECLALPWTRHMTFTCSHPSVRVTSTHIMRLSLYIASSCACLKLLFYIYTVQKLIDEYDLLGYIFIVSQKKVKGQEENRKETSVKKKYVLYSFGFEMISPYERTVVTSCMQFTKTLQAQ